MKEMFKKYTVFVAACLVTSLTFIGGIVPKVSAETPAKCQTLQLTVESSGVAYGDCDPSIKVKDGSKPLPNHCYTVEAAPDLKSFNYVVADCNKEPFNQEPVTAVCPDSTIVHSSDPKAKASDLCVDHQLKSSAQATPACGDGVTACTVSVPSDCKGGNSTAGTVDCIDSNSIITRIINPAIKIFSVLVGVIAVIMLIVAGILYSSAQDDPKRVALARKIIVDVIIALVAYVFLFAFLNFILPQGVRG